MRRGIFIPAGVVRVAVGVMAAAACAIAWVEGPEVVRYLRIRAM
ncbi:hypothetical protein [Streptomyces palmae]|nr:hypothetical protein [Streptomyces palmae]